jgi:hypothetical protein
MEINDGVVENVVTQRNGNLETANRPGTEFKELRGNHVGTKK